MAGLFVQRYAQRKALSQLGYNFHPNKITVFEAEAMVYIHGQFEAIKIREMKRDSKKKGKK